MTNQRTNLRRVLSAAAVGLLLTGGTARSQSAKVDPQAEGKPP